MLNLYIGTIEKKLLHFGAYKKMVQIKILCNTDFLLSIKCLKKNNDKTNKNKGYLYP